MLKEDLKIFWQKIEDWKCPADIQMIYMSWVYSLLVKECVSWVLDTGLVGMKRHTEQRNARATMGLSNQQKNMG